MISQVLFIYEQPKKNKMAFVGVLSQIKLLFGQLVIQFVWYILKQLFTSVTVKVVDIYLTASRLGKYPPLFIILAFWMVLACDLLEHRCTIDVVITKWQKVLRIKIIFYVTGQKITYQKVLTRHWTGSRSRKKKNKAVSFRKWFRKTWAVSVGSWARLNHAQNWSWYLGLSTLSKICLTNWRQYFMRLSCYWSWISSAHCQSSCGSADY